MSRSIVSKATPLTMLAVVIAAVIAAVTAGAAICKIRKRKRISSEEHKAEGLLASGIGKNAELFDGLYEGLYLSVLKPELDNRDGYLEWCGRVRHLENQNEFQAAFLKELEIGDNADPAVYQKAARYLLQLIEKAKICRSQDQELKTSAGVLRDYLYLGPPAPEDGEVCVVLKPAWYHDGKLVEQGILMPKEMGK